MLSGRCKSGTIGEIRVSLLTDPSTIKDNTELIKESTLAEIVFYLREIENSRIVVISGARISLPLDIPDFRSHDVGLYHAPFENECYYCDAFNKNYFLQDPAPLYKITASVLKNDYEPTLSHYFIALLEHKNLLLKNYTLNMDDVENLAGITRYTQIYGNLYSFVCINCRKEFSFEWTKVRLDEKKIPQCTNCASLIKPNILLYGEELPTDIYEEFEEDMKECKLLIVLGSTLSDEPLATVLRGVDFKFPRIFINDVHPYNFSDFHFYCEHDHSDVIWLGNIDSTCKKLVKLLGWEQELQEVSGMDLLGPEEEV
ncbi:NAD-dependent deacetylase sir2A [Halyomorpha halys]|uniref:NAD-dependent deacetylase sir2A n=1 Tax=Halyomorpha halys TaxID=286706 RepID=UPI0006D51B88|nr:NAD-dependent deacetylase sir2A [Halyomorpha halys]